MEPGVSRAERRRYPRDRVSLRVECGRHDGVAIARASSLGGGGLFLEQNDLTNLGSELDVRFRPAKHIPTIEAHVRVRHQIPGKGSGVEFLEIRPEDRQNILRLILHRETDKRRHARAPFVTQVEFEGGTFLGFSKDVSAGGMFIETVQPLPERASLTLRFNLDDAGPIVVVPAEVRYTLPKLGVGVQFSDVPDSDVARIEAYVARCDAAS